MNRTDYDRNLAALNARDITVRGKSESLSTVSATQVTGHRTE